MKISNGKNPAEIENELNILRLNALFNLSQLKSSSLQEISEYALNEAVKLTQSEIGFINFLDSDEKNVTQLAYSKGIMEECGILDEPPVFCVADSGIWAESIRQRRPVIINDYENTNLQKKGFPEGHTSIKRLLLIPVFENDRIVATAALANKKTEYDQGDVLQLQLFMNGMWLIIKQKETEDALRQSELKYRQFIENANTIVVQLDRNADIVFMNKFAFDFFGYTRTEIIGKNVIGTIVPAIDSAGRDLAKMIENVLTDPEQFVENENENIRKNGDRVWIEWRNKAVYDTKGELSEILSFGIDVTGKNRYLQEIEKREQTIATLLNATTNLATLHSHDGTVLALNEEATERLGVTAEELVGKNIFDFFPPEIAAQRKKIFDKVIHLKLPYRFEDTFGEKCYNTSVYPIVNDSGDVEMIAIFAENITERKKTEQKLLESEELYRVTLSSISDAIFLTDNSGRIIFACDNVNVNFGYTAEEIMQMKSIDKLLKGQIFELKELQHLGEISNIEWEITDKFGYRRFLFISVKRVDIKNATILYCCRDVTERKKIETELRNSEQKYRTLYTDTPAMLHSTDSEGHLISVSNYWLEKTGYSREEVIGKKSTDFLTEESRKKAEKLFPQYYRDGYIKDIPYQFVYRNGDVLDVLLSATAEYNAQGEFVRSLAVINDITQLKKTEAELLHAKEEVESKTLRLEELNTALRVLIEQREQEILDFERNILNNVTILIKPYLEKLKLLMHDDRQKTLISIIETNFDKITEPIKRNAEDILQELSPVEMQVADLIKQGKSSKEIAEILTISESTVFTHRKHIRKKLGLHSTNVNLSTFLKKN